MDLDFPRTPAAAAAEAAICQNQLLSLPPSRAPAGQTWWMLLQDQNVWLHLDHLLKETRGRGAQSSPTPSFWASTEYTGVDADGIHPGLLLLPPFDLRGSGPSKNRAGVKVGGAGQRGLENQRRGRKSGVTLSRHVSTGMKSLSESCLRRSAHKQGCSVSLAAFVVDVVVVVAAAVCAREVSRFNPRGVTSGVRSLPFH